jgi:hypothetical protein
MKHTTTYIQHLEPPFSRSKTQPKPTKYQRKSSKPKGQRHSCPKATKSYSIAKS